MLSIRKVSAQVQKRGYSNVAEYNKRLVTRAQEGIAPGSLKDIDSDIHKILSEMNTNNVKFNAETNEILMKISQGIFFSTFYFFFSQSCSFSNFTRSL